MTRKLQPPARFIVILFLFAAGSLFSANSKAQGNPILQIDDDITRFAYSATGRIAYATRHVFSAKKIDLQRDDIWICEPDGKKHRILLGERFVRGSGAFSYTVRALRWSPDGSKIAAELATNEIINDDGDTREGVSTLLLDDTLHENIITGPASEIPGASNASWTSEGQDILYLKEEPAPQAASAKPASTSPAVKLFTMYRHPRPSGTGPVVLSEMPLWQGQVFFAVAWGPGPGTGIAIQPAQGKTGPPRLAWLDVSHQSQRPLGTLEGYAGGLSVSPSGKKIAYWIDNGQLDVRDVEVPTRTVRLRVPIGSLAWSPDEARILVKRGAANRSGGLVWFALPPLTDAQLGVGPTAMEVPPQSVLHDLEFRQFDISPDGRSLAVVEPGKRNLLVYPLI